MKIDGNNAFVIDYEPAKGDPKFTMRQLGTFDEDYEMDLMQLSALRDEIEAALAAMQEGRSYP